MTKTTTHKGNEWKVEPLPESKRRSIADLSPAELVALLSAAYRRIGALEAELGRRA